MLERDLINVQKTG